MNFWSVREDVAPPTGFQQLVDYPNGGIYTDGGVKSFPKFMQDRAAAERFRAIIQLYVGDPVGPDPGTIYTSAS